MRFNDLAEDVIFDVALRMSPLDVLALSQTCSYIRHTLSRPFKQLWEKLLLELNDFEAPFLEDRSNVLDISHLSSESIRAQVISSCTARKNWARKTGPRPSRHHTIDLKNGGGFFGKLPVNRNDDGANNIKVVRGSSGRYITVVWTLGYVQIWDITNKSCVYTYPQLGAFTDDCILACDAEMGLTEDPASGRLTLVIKGQNSDNGSAKCFIEEHTFDLKTRTARRRPRVWVNCEGSSWLRICGDVIISQINCDGAYFFDRNTRNGFEVSLATSHGDHVEGFTYAGGHLFFAFCSRIGRFFLRSFDFQGFFRDRTAVHDDISIREGQARVRQFDCRLHPAKSFLGSIELEYPADFFLERHRATLHSFEPDWQTENTRTTIFVVAKLRVMSLMPSQTMTRSLFIAYNVQATEAFLGLPRFLRKPQAGEYNPITRPDESAAANHTSVVAPHLPQLTLVQQSPVVAQNVPHFHIEEHVCSLGRGGRGLIASWNNASKTMRYRPFSIESLFSAPKPMGSNDPVVTIDSTNPITFGKGSESSTICPGDASLEPLSGALIYTKNSKRGDITKELAIQFYD